MTRDWKDQLVEMKGEGDNSVPNTQDKKSIFFADDTKTISEELIDTEAKKWALSFIHPNSPSDRRIQNPKLTSDQLRRFHNDVRDLEAKIEALGEQKFDRMRPLIKMIKSKVAYACPSNGRERKVPSEFREYMELMINNIEDIYDFRAFSKCFESVVGYFYGEGGR